MTSASRLVRRLSLAVTAAALCMLLPSAPLQFTAAAQGSKVLSTVFADNGQKGITFDITALRSTRLYRFWCEFGATGSYPVEIWMHPGGTVNANDGLWQYLGTATVNVTNTAAYTEIPLTLNLLMNPNTTSGFLIYNVNSNIDYRTGVTPYIFSDANLSINTEKWGTDGTTTPGTNTTALTFGFYPRQFCGAVYYDDGILGMNDAGVSAITTPKDFCAGTHPVTVRLENFGGNRITSATIQWTLDGVPQPPVPWAGLLDTLTTTTRQTLVVLGTRTFAAQTPYTIRAWSTLPNGVTDTVPNNDTTQATRMAALSGTLTIGGSGPDFPTVSAAAAALNTYGVCGPVIFSIRPGVYPEQVSVSQFPGASQVNTVTFRSETGNAADVRLTFSGTSTAPHTLQLDGADWVRLLDLTIEGTNASYAHVLRLQGGATNCIVQRCRILGPVTTSTSTNLTNIYASGTAENENRFLDNTILNGAYAVYYYGVSSSTLSTGTQFLRNSIRDFYYAGLRVYYQDAPVLEDNVIFTASTTTNYLLYAGYCQNRQSIARNRVTATGTGTKYGMYVYYCTAQPGAEGSVVNNMVSLNGGSSTVYGLYVYYSNNQNVDFNTVDSRSTSTSARALCPYYGSNHRFTNNIAVSSGSGYALYFYNTTGIREMNYNVYTTAGANLAYWNGTNLTSLAALQAASLMEASTISKPLVFRDPAAGDLHLSGASQNDVALTGRTDPAVTIDIDGDPRILPYRGADEACYILPNTVSARIVDGNGAAIDWFEVPGTLNVEYTVAYPSDAANVGITVNLYSIPGNQLMMQYTFSAQKLAGQTLHATTAVPVPPTLGTGYYRVQIVFTTKNSCGDYVQYQGLEGGLLAVPQGQAPCIVWPGDVNNDGIVNYGDRSALNKYILAANLRPSWLSGPARYRPDAATNPMTYYTWEGQPAAPWQTPEGCYMDADGNGLVTTYDLLVTRVNWMRSHGGWEPKPNAEAALAAFELGAGYPNPFTASTTLQWMLPERSRVHIIVTDALGRTVAVLVDGERSPGVHAAMFDGSGLAPGVYHVTAAMLGLDTGITATRTVRVTRAR